LPAFGRPISAT